MIKEIEVGGVKYSITLSDDMIGSGLKRDADGRVGITASGGLEISGPYNSLSVDVNGLAGSGLVASGGKLNVIGGGGSVDANSLAGSGLRSIEDNKLALALSASNLLMFGNDSSLDINLSQLCGSGLKEEKGKIMPSLSGDAYLTFADDWSMTVDTSVLASGLVDSGGGLGATSSGLRVNVGSGLRRETSTKGELVIDYENLFDSNSFRIIRGPITSVGVKVTSGLEIYPENGIKVKIAERSSGLRLILNDKGELDVTQ